MTQNELYLWRSTQKGEWAPHLQTHHLLLKITIFSGLVVWAGVHKLNNLSQQAISFQRHTKLSIHAVEMSCFSMRFYRWQQGWVQEEREISKCHIKSIDTVCMTRLNEFKGLYQNSQMFWCRLMRTFFLLSECTDGNWLCGSLNRCVRSALTPNPDQTLSHLHRRRSISDIMDPIFW